MEHKEYLKKNPTYHIEDTDFKWNNFKNIITKSKINYSEFNLIAEVGCGSGQILSHAKKSDLFKGANFIGYDTSPEAINIAKNLDKTIKYKNEDLTKIDLEKKFDLLIVSDVFEHIPNYHKFLREIRKKSKYQIFNIPLEISFTSLIRTKNIFETSYNEVGHLHFFSDKTAKLTLEKNGYKILSFSFSKNRLFELKKKFTLKKFLIYLPQFCLELINNRLASNIFGGYSLVVITESN
mgnify:CR=1 FL=1|tara:strand:- start:1858 stop:2568 length:711 start_codon:yes stop_codon:yes gene_type:complete